MAESPPWGLLWMLKTNKTKSLLFYISNSIIFSKMNATVPLRSCLRTKQLLVTHWQRYFSSSKLQNTRMWYTREQGTDQAERQHVNPSCRREMWQARRPMTHVRLSQDQRGIFVVVLDPPKMSSQWPTCLFLDLTEHTEESWLHPMATQSMLSERDRRACWEREVILSTSIKTLHGDSASSVESRSYEVTVQKHFRRMPFCKIQME